MALPELILVGEAGVGKDAVADFMVQNHGAVAIAQADPMKRLVKDVFGFSEETLWGASSLRNATDESYRSESVRLNALWKLDETEAWVREVLPGRNDQDIEEAFEMLVRWGKELITGSGHGLTARLVLQTLGTEWGRNIDEDMWANYAGLVSRKLLRGGYVYNQATGAKIGAPVRRPTVVVIKDGRFPNEPLAVKSRGGLCAKIIDPAGTAASQAAQAAGVKGHASETSQRDIPMEWFDAVLFNDKTQGLPYLSALATDLYNHLFNPARVLG